MTDLASLASTLDRPGGDLRLRCLSLLHGAAMISRFDAASELIGLGLERDVTFAEMEETALQLVAYGGFPRAIELLTLIAERRPTPAVTEAEAPGKISETLAAGRTVFVQVYGDNAEKVLAGLDQLLPGFAPLVLESAYGRLLARPQIPLGERELLAVAALGLAALAAPLGSHIRGALLNGVPPGAVQDTLHTCNVLADHRARPVIAQALDRIERKVYSR
ncbi:MAG: alkylhydroperoxidase/carboxymuconolactone decarboxylase family protein YurZ [Pseudohongiellaceae bacterium]|jgi:alkylhydroperoxidase/carboxymuconolactone decarboxylase family protein YurZ